MAKPRIGLIGVGSFGRHYLRHLEEFARVGRIHFSHIAVASERRAKELSETYPTKMIVTDYRQLIGLVDAVCIVTPPETHAPMVMDFLPHTAVLVEKPLTLTLESAQALELLAASSTYPCMVGQLFRFHAVTAALLTTIRRSADDGDEVVLMELVFLNPLTTDSGRPIVFEFIHWCDLVHYLFPHSGAQLFSIKAQHEGRRLNAAVPYTSEVGDFTAHYRLGWEGEIRQRMVTIRYRSGKTVVANYLANELKITNNNGEIIVESIPEMDTLELELSTWLAVVGGVTENPVPPSAVLPSLQVAEHIYKLTL